MSGLDSDGSVELDLQNSQRQVEQLSQEILELYRQVNLLYRLGDVFRAGLKVEEIAKILMRESVKVVRAAGAFVSLGDGLCFGQSVDNPNSQLTVPIETPQGKIGEITLYDKRRGFFTASDEKLVRAASRQAGVAFENSKRIEGLIEEKKALESLNDELRIIDQMKSDFVSNVSHELRTPLASIKGFAATIIDDEQMPFEVARDFVGIINDESDKLIIIINDLLDVSKMMSGHMEYHLEVVQLEQVVGEVVKLLGIQADSKSLALECEVIDSVRLRIDSTRISQVLINLIGNAIKFTDEGAVRVSQWVADGYAHIAISDTGIGIPKAVLPHIFDKFYRVENVVHTKEGTGLGLALVRGIVDYHNGRIDVESVEGTGSVFTVRLPLKVRAVGHEN